MSDNVERIRDLARPRLPFPLRAWNAVGGRLAKRLGPLDEQSLCQAAQQRTGHENFGDATFREPLAVLLHALETEAKLSPLGRVLSREFLIQLLGNRLRLEHLVDRHPEILDEPIVRPIVIVGLPRTGTSHLHALMAQDPMLRSLPYWESLEPFPGPKDIARPGRPDPRLRRCQGAMRILNWAMPHFQRMHELTAESPHEEIQLLAIAFSTMLFEVMYSVPSYCDWYRSHDQTGAYLYLRRILQAMQWRDRNPRRWLLKSPQHLEQLPALLQAFPDATVIQTHRDPVRVTASMCTMVAYGARMQTDHVDPNAIGRHVAERIEDLLRGSIEARAHLVPDRVHDVHFEAFMREEMETVRRTFAFADQPWNDAIADAVETYYKSHPRGRYGVIDYRLADVGLDADERRVALAFYQDHFQIPSDARA